MGGKERKQRRITARDMDKKKRNGYQESATPEKILKLHKPFSQCLPCNLASHRVIAI